MGGQCWKLEEEMFHAGDGPEVDPERQVEQDGEGPGAEPSRGGKTAKSHVWRLPPLTWSSLLPSPADRH